MNKHDITDPKSARPQTRLHYLDNLRIYLTVLVILHHAALAYGGSGNWGVDDPATVLYLIQVPMLLLNIPTIVKFVIVSAIAVPVCFLLSVLIRKLPYARRVLG